MIYTAENHFLRPKSQFAGSHYFRWRWSDTFPINDPCQSHCISIKRDDSRRQIRVKNSAREESARATCWFTRGSRKGTRAFSFLRVSMTCRNVMFFSHVFSREGRSMYQVPKTMRDESRGALSSVTCALNIWVRIWTWFVWEGYIEGFGHCGWMMMYTSSRIARNTTLLRQRR